MEPSRQPDTGRVAVGASARLEMFEANERLRLTLDHVGWGVGVLDLVNTRPGALLDFNPRLCELLGVSRTELLRRRSRRLSPLREIRGLAAEIQALATDAESARHFDRTLTRADGDLRVIEHWLSLVVLPDDRLTYVVLVLDDVTPSRRRAAATQPDTAPLHAPDVPSARPPPTRRFATDAHTLALGDAAGALGVSPSTVRRWADHGRLEAVRTTGGHRRFSADGVRQLSQDMARSAGPMLRPASLPSTSIPALAELIADERDALLARATGLLYEPHHGGWFAGQAGMDHLHVWLGVLRGAADRGNGWDSAIAATHDLADRARYGGASHVEGHLVLERLQDLFQFRLRERGASSGAQTDTRRVMRALDRAIIEAPQEASTP